MRVCSDGWLKPRSISGRKAWEHIIGIDGEGVGNDPAQPQRYTLLAASTGQAIEYDDMSSVRCFDFLLSLAKRSLIVGYSIKYDIDMWLKDVPLDNLIELWEDGHTEWNGYWLVYHPGKMFSVGRQRRIKPYLTHGGEKKKRITYDEHVTVWDVFGFFQSSFVAALYEWDIGTAEQRARIERMKSQRGSFSDDDAAQVKAYCLDECELLAAMMSKLIDYAQSLGLRLSRYDGAGAVASAMLRKHGVANYIDVPPKPVHDAALHAYFGGRFETAIIGYLNEAHVYDINSAYPQQTASLPCLVHGAWRRSTDVVPRGVYHCRWNLEDELVTWGPFPYRLPDNAICFPLSGEGWYWGSEVAAAQRLYGGAIDVVDGYTLVTRCEHQPFGFVPEYYAQRRQLKADGNFAQIILKLGMNSLYGKCAQSIGGKIVGRSDDGELIHDRPRYQSFVWAGMITAGTRAMILDALRLADGNVVSIATDGIISRVPLPLDCGKGLGQWEHKRVTECAIIQNGVYRYRHEQPCDARHSGSCTPNCQYVTRARGFSGREFDWGNIAFVFGLKRQHGVYQTQVQRFIGLGSALQRAPQLTDWRHWVPFPKTVKLNPPNRQTYRDLGLREPHRHQVASVAYSGMLTEGMSSPYRLAQHFAHLWSDELENAEHQG